MATYSATSPLALRFCEEYLLDLNGSAAAERAGYSAGRARQTANELLKMPAVQARIAELKAARSEKVEVTQRYVIENLVEVVERCMERAPVMVRRGREMVQIVDADDRHVWQFNAKGAIGSLNLLGRHLGMFVDKLEVKNSSLEDIIRAAAGESDDAGDA